MTVNEKATIRTVLKGEYGAQYAHDRGTCYICGTNRGVSNLIKLTAHEIFILELFCKATNNTPPKGFTYFCKDRETCDKWVMQRNTAMRAAPPTVPAPVKFHPNPAVTSAKRSRNKYG